jgi:hypothetical protein
MSVPRLPEALRAAQEDIHKHSDSPVQFSPPHWRRQLVRHGVSTTAVDALERMSATDAEFPAVDRSQLVGYARGLDLYSPAGRRDAFVAAMVWGGGTPRRKDGGGGDPRTPWRIAVGLSTPRRGEPDRLLVDSLVALEHGDLPAAYRAVTSLHRVGGSFGTKWLWLAGEVRCEEPRPLIWDSVITRWLACQHKDGSYLELRPSNRFPSHSNADAQRYKAYVEAMHAWAAELGLGDREDAGARLEAYLFAQR